MMITSVGNPYVKRLRELASGKREAEYFIVEGEKQVAELNDNWKVESYAVSESFAARRTCPENAVLLADHVFDRVSNTMTPQGIIAICEKRRKRPVIDFLNSKGLYVICDKISDPGNLGAIVRNAHAFNCDCLLISADSADIYNPKIVRASAGSLFHTTFIQDSDTNEYIRLLKAYGVRVIAAHPRGDKLISHMDMTIKTAIVIGNEAHGVSENVLLTCDDLALIPMPGGSESLNATVACGVVLYEAVRQRLNIK